jgi:hypothetical protein
MYQLDPVREAIAEFLRPEHFYVAPPAQLEWEHVPTDETPWELYRGQLVPKHLTRSHRTFESWNVYLMEDGKRSGEPIVSLKLEAESKEVHVVRGILCWIWEGYHAGDNIYLSREVQRWVQELVGTMKLDGGLAGVRDELATWIFRAFVGLSRLPLTSVEAPLPGFSLGKLAYFHNPKGSEVITAQKRQPLSSWREMSKLYRQGWPKEMQTKWLEFVLRSFPREDVEEAATVLARHWQVQGVTVANALTQFRAVFNDVALSPYTDFVDKTLAVLRRLVEARFFTVGQHVDFIGWLLRQLARHLTAYDLVTFHHRGANYPDALLLDAALKDYLGLIDQHPRLFAVDDTASRLRRRALRAGWLHRRRYEGHAVPDAPTSPGENMRVLPPPHERVPEDQILNPSKRTKRLYDGDPLPGHVGDRAGSILQQCGQDLLRSEELHELGMALFVERPLGSAKAIGESDLSPLLAHEAYSRSLAERALAELAREPLMGLSADDVANCRELLAQPWPEGGMAATTLERETQQVVSLADAVNAARDFVVMRTLPRSVRAFCEWLGVAEVLQRAGFVPDTNDDWLIVGNSASGGRIQVLIRDRLGKQTWEGEILLC